MIAAIAAGFAIATWKTARIAHGVLARPMFSVALTGFVETRDIRERTDRFVLRVVTMESARGTTKLERVRLSVKKGTAPAVGSFVELKARLLPSLTPVRPGSYDFSRDMFFAGIGASGFVMGAIKTAEPPATGGGLRLGYSAVMQGLRDTIDARIRTTLEGDKRAIATALLTGRRDAISPPVNDAMFISGLGMCSRSPAITWPSSPASCSSRCGRCWRCFPRSRSGTPSRNGRRRQRSLPRRSICCCRGRKWQHNARSS
jgi:competence protein ComEC